MLLLIFKPLVSFLFPIAQALTGSGVDERLSILVNGLLCSSVLRGAQKLVILPTSSAPLPNHPKVPS